MSNEEIRVVIADDEPGMRMIMRKMIEKAVGFTLCGEADNGPDLLKLVERYKPQVCFLDVEMPGMTGLECAKAIQDTDPRTILVFATAHDDYMAQAFEVYAFDYMVKPFKVERVMKTLERIRQVIGGRAQPQSEQAEKLEEKLRKNRFTLQDYYDQLQQLRGMGDQRREQRAHHAAPQGRRELHQPVGYPAGAARKPLDRAVCHERAAL